MAIKFSCPNCGKALNVKDQLAGKRGACSGCKKVITIPFPVAEAHHPDVEAMALQAFAEETAAPAPVETKTFEFNCPMCDEKISVSVDLEGKRTPCPECRRIIKVPLRVKDEPKDWRRIDLRGPSGAKQNLEPAPEGAWGSTSAAGVSRETLLETGAITEEADPDEKRRRLMRLTTAGIAVVVLALAGIGAYSFFTRGKADKYLERALAMANGEAKLAPEQVAAIHWAAADYLARSGLPDAATKANEEYVKAAGALGNSKSQEREAMLIDLALTRLELGGDKAEADKGTALEWSQARQAVRQTLQQLHTEEARRDAVRLLTHRLAAKGQLQEAQKLAGLLGSGVPGPGAKAAMDGANELVAVAAMELFRAGNKKEAQALADTVLTPPPTGKEKPKPKPVLRGIVALAVVLGKDEPKPRVEDKKGKEKLNEEDVENYVLGKVEGLARRGELAPAREMLASTPPPIRLRGLITLAALAADATPADSADLTAALELAEPEAKGQAELAWPLYRLGRLAVKAGQEQRALRLAETIPDEGLKAQVQLAVFRARWAQTKDKIEDAEAANIKGNTGAAALARVAVARHNMARDGGTVKIVEGWDEPNRAAGLAGLALGMQDKRK